MVDGPSTRQLWRPIEGIDTCAVVAEHETAGDAVNAMKAMGVGA